MKKISPVRVIMKRELSAWFSSFVGWLVTGLFLLLNGLFFFSTFFLSQRADLRNMFSIMPIWFALFIPPVTMRLFAEENRSGSIETLMTLPVSTMQVVLGKYFAALISCIAMIAPTLLYVVVACIYGDPDFGPIIGGYIGSVFLAASFCAIGVFASSTSKNQIVAFIICFVICIFLATIDMFLILIPSSLTSFLTFFSAGTHFESVSRGIVDSRDLIYFVSLTAVFLGLTIKTENARRTM